MPGLPRRLLRIQGNASLQGVGLLASEFVGEFRQAKRKLVLESGELFPSRIANLFDPLFLLLERAREGRPPFLGACFVGWIFQNAHRASFSVGDTMLLTASQGLTRAKNTAQR